MSRNVLGRIATGSAVAATAVLIIAFASNKPVKSDGTPKTPTGVAQVTIENGETVLMLPAAEQANLALETVQLATSSYRQTASATAVVLPGDTLVGLRSNVAMAKVNLEKARATMEVTREEYARLKKLYAAHENVAKKTLQAQEAALRIARADLTAAKEAVRLQEDMVRQQWGATVAQWMASDAGPMQRLLERQDVLIDMTLPADKAATAPTTVNFETPAGRHIAARLVSPYPGTDPRVQGVNYLYITVARPELASGVNLIAHFPTGARVAGVVIPASAIVWVHGQSWAYLATAAGRYVRHEVPTHLPAPGGWFVTAGFKAGDSVVVRGAQQLLAIESSAASPQPSSDGEGDND